MKASLLAYMFGLSISAPTLAAPMPDAAGVPSPGNAPDTTLAPGTASSSRGPDTEGYPYICYSKDSEGASFWGADTSYAGATSAALWWCKSYSNNRSSCHVTYCMEVQY